jgi:Domain of unknown function (DUF4440)
MSHRLVLILLLVNGVIYAQQQLEGNKLKMPGPDVQNLMLGTWSIKVQYPPTPDMPGGGTGEGSETWRPGPGRQSVVEEYRERNSKGEVEGLGLAWWDREAQGRRFVWCENDLPSGCYVSKQVAKWENESLVWNEEQVNTGAKTAYSEVFREITPNSFVQELQEGESLATLHRTAIISATRVVSPPVADSEGAVMESSLRTAMANRHQAMLDGDEAVVDRLTAREYAQTDIFGHVQDKAAWMSEYFRPLASLLKSGKFRWEQYEETDVRITMLGETAVVTGALKMKGTGARFTSGRPEAAPQTSVEGTLRFTRVWFRQNGAWVLAALHNAAPLGVQTKPAR